MTDSLSFVQRLAIAVVVLIASFFVLKALKSHYDNGVIAKNDVIVNFNVSKSIDNDNKKTDAFVDDYAGFDYIDRVLNSGEGSQRQAGDQALFDEESDAVADLEEFQRGFGYSELGHDDELLDAYDSRSGDALVLSLSYKCEWGWYYSQDNILYDCL